MLQVARYLNYVSTELGGKFYNGPYSYNLYKESKVGFFFKLPLI